ncbi:MAG: hypothetical protein C5S38_08465 [Candidatus Methanophagaceae archaeon]|nr:MAG: hypothetical protein C5S38_08465 [Methanophagales archaeon]
MVCDCGCDGKCKKCRCKQKRSEDEVDEGPNVKGDFFQS